MQECTECREKGNITAFYDRYDDEIYMRCSCCGRKVTRPVCFLCGDEITEGEKAFRIEKDIYCTDCVECITV